MQDITNHQHPTQSMGKDFNHDHPYDFVNAEINEGAASCCKSNLDGMKSSLVDDDLAASLEKLKIINAKLDKDLLKTITTHPILHEYLWDFSAEYRELTLLRNEGWASEKADEHFMILREKADNVTPETQRVFYKQMCEIGNAMDKAFNLSLELELNQEEPQFLDICMAPGGFSGAILENAPGSHACGISLPISKGGHPLCIKNWEDSDNIDVHFLDVTMLATEMGLTDIPPDHPDLSEFLTLRPFERKEFGLVFCDGNVLRIHVRPSYREGKERHRLLKSQLVLAFQRIKPGGTLVMRLHKIEALETVELIRLFKKFSTVYVWKPVKIHAARSSFYMVAKDLQPDCPEAIQAVSEWKLEWKELTLNTKEGDMEAKPFDNNDPVRIEIACGIVSEFGQQLIQMARPIWAIQAEGLRVKPFNTGRSTTFRPPRNPNLSAATRMSMNSTAMSNRARGLWRPKAKVPERKDTLISSLVKPVGSHVPQQRRGLFRTGNPRLLNETNRQEHDAEIASAVSPNKKFRHNITQQRRSSFLNGDPRTVDGVRPKQLHESYVPTNSGFWLGDPRSSTADVTAEERRNLSLQERASSPEFLRRRIMETNKAAAAGIRTPGGSLRGATITKNSSIFPTRPSRPLERISVSNDATTANNEFGASHTSATIAKPSSMSPTQRLHPSKGTSLTQPSLPTESKSLGPPVKIALTDVNTERITQSPRHRERVIVPVTQNANSCISLSSGKTAFAHPNLFEILGKDSDCHQEDSFERSLIPSTKTSLSNNKSSGSDTLNPENAALHLDPETRTFVNHEGDSC